MLLSQRFCPEKSEITGDTPRGEHTRREALQVVVSGSLSEKAPPGEAGRRSPRGTASSRQAKGRRDMPLVQA